MDVLTAQQAAGASPSNPEPEKASPMKNTGIPERGSDAAPWAERRAWHTCGKGRRAQGLTGEWPCVLRDRGGVGDRRLDGGLGTLGCQAESEFYPVSNPESPRYLRTRSVLFQDAKVVLWTELCPPPLKFT